MGKNTFGDNIRRFRKALGKSQAEVSLDTEVSRQTLSNIENGKVIPFIKSVRQLLEYYSVDGSVFFNDPMVDLELRSSQMSTEARVKAVTEEYEKRLSTMKQETAVLRARLEEKDRQIENLNQTINRLTSTK